LRIFENELLKLTTDNRDLSITNILFAKHQHNITLGILRPRQSRLEFGATLVCYFVR